MTASNYLGNMVLNAFLRGVATTLPTDIFVSLHTADPGATGASEADTGTWPAYVRKSALAGGAIADAFTEAVGPGANKVATNENEIKFPAYDGAGTYQMTHFALWDAVSGGNCLYTGKLVVDPLDVESTAAPKTLGPTDELVFYANQLGIVIE